MKIVRADILSNLNFNKPIVILHGCNCFCNMGAGIAKYLKQQYPLVYTVDKQTGFGDKKKLGSLSIAGIHGNFHIVNCYSQYNYGFKKGGKPPVEYKAIGECLEKVAQLYNGWEIRSPKIGCGLAGGDWNIVEPMFEKILGNQNLTIYFK